MWTEAKTGAEARSLKRWVVRAVMPAVQRRLVVLPLAAGLVLVTPVVVGVDVTVICLPIPEIDCAAAEREAETLWLEIIF